MDIFSFFCGLALPQNWEIIEQTLNEKATKVSDKSIQEQLIKCVSQGDFEANNYLNVKDGLCR